MEGPLLVLALVLLAVAPSPSLAVPVDDVPCEGRMGKVVGRGPWRVPFGDCEFTGNTDGAPLVRKGSCPDAEGFLDLQFRNITVVPATAFQGMGKMTKLYLDFNRFSALPEGVFAGLASLNNLGLYCNQVTGILHAGVFHGLSSLSDLNLANNNLTTLSPGVFAGLSSLINIDLSRNPLFTLSGETFAGLALLRILSVYQDYPYLLQCVPLTSEARAALWSYRGPITCNNLPVVTVCGGVVGLMALSVSVAYYFKIHGIVTEKTMVMNAGVCSVVAQIAAVIAVVRGAQSKEDQLWSFGTIVLVLLVPFDIWSLWSYLKKNKRRREYLALFKAKCKGRDGLKLEEFASWESKSFPFESFPFKWLDDNGDKKISKQEYEKGYELVEAFREFEVGKCRPLCLLLRAKYLEEKKKVKANTNPPSPPPPSPPPPSVPENSNLARVHPSPAELSDLPQSTDGTCLAHNRSHSATTTAKCDPKTLKVGCSAVAGKGLRRAVGLDDDKVLGNFMKDPELAIECEILVAGLRGHEDGYGCIEDIDNYYSIKYGKSGDWEEKEINLETMKIDPMEDDENGKAPIPNHVKASAENGKYHGGIFKKKDYDFRNDGNKLKDFCEHDASKKAGLFIYQVLILRLYTSTTFRLFNGPMRKLLMTDNQISQLTDGQKSHHPLRFTIYALTEGIKKLRAVEAERDPVGFNKSMDLWRGVADMKVNEDFLEQGGTEMAVMSSTSDKDVALSYARRETPKPGLVIKYKTFGLSRGVSIQFLSLYPKEVEFIYPPLTFLSPVTGTTYEEGSVTIVEVMPQMS